jgi:acyl carrier protein
MADTRMRLQDCFAAVFQDLEADEIPRATTATIPDWDSVSTVTLLTVVEEEFGVRVRPEDIPRFVSFQAILDYVEARTAVVPSNPQTSRSDR